MQAMSGVGLDDGKRMSFAENDTCNWLEQLGHPATLSI
jgi:hypothetical protein